MDPFHKRFTISSLSIFGEKCSFLLSVKNKFQMLGRPSGLLLNHPGIPEVTLCFCTGSHAAAAAARRFLFTRKLLNNFLDFFIFGTIVGPDL